MRERIVKGGTEIAPSHDISARARRQPERDSRHVGAVNDPAEREADRIADRILDGLQVTASHRREPAPGVAMPSGGTLDDDDARRLRFAGSGDRLAPTLLGRIQPMVPRDLSGVRVHTGTGADAVARRIDARAFTSGSDIYFRRGEYAPGSPGGMRTLAHEIGHVAQGGDGVRRLVGLAEPARYRAGDVGTSNEEAMLSGWADVANAFHKVQLMVEDSATEYGDQPAFGDVEAVKHVTDGAGIYMSAADTVAGGMEGIAGFRNVFKGHKHGDSLSKNLGATQLESGVTGVLDGGSSTGAGIALKGASLAGEQIPGLDVAMNLKSAGLQTKAATEDATASAKLARQRTRAKREADVRMPLKVRRERYDKFLEVVVEKERLDAAAKARPQPNQQGASSAGGAGGSPSGGSSPGGKGALSALKSAGAKVATKVAAGGKALKDKAAAAGARAGRQAHATWFGLINFKSGETKRFGTLAAQFQTDTGNDPRIAKDDFLKWMAQKGHKDFGYGSEHRGRFEREFKQNRGTGTLDRRYADFKEAEFTETRDLRKVAAFGRRRKGETASLSSVSAAGSALDAAGTFTAGADFGATKASGKTLKGGVSSYKGVKGLVKRGRRVHKLRQAKNKLEYGGKRNRGALWGMKSFVAGDVAGSQRRVLGEMKAQKTGGRAKKKTVKQLSATDTAMVKKLLKTQLRRRFDDLLQCLGSSDTTVQQRAKQIVHVIAETNLAGALSKVNDSDLEKVGSLHRKGKSRTADEQKQYRRMKGALLGIFQKQLAGVGG